MPDKNSIDARSCNSAGPFFGDVGTPANPRPERAGMPMMWKLFNAPFDIRPDGTVHAPMEPGLGFTLRADALEKFRHVDGAEFVS